MRCEKQNPAYRDTVSNFFVKLINFIFFTNIDAPILVISTAIILRSQGNKSHDVLLVNDILSNICNVPVSPLVRVGGTFCGLGASLQYFF